jgi:gamma-glutamyl:cysteine ligase YbdK (ATP-grasp superfamily)
MHNPKSRKRLKEQKLKSFKFGMEFELMTLDTKGYVVPVADKVIKRVRKKASRIDIKRECAQNMLEIASFPHEDVPDIMEQAMKDLETVLYNAEKEGIVLYPYATYPGSFKPQVHEEKHCQMKQKVFGEKRFSVAGRCIGLHCHYTLPWGVFDTKKHIIKERIKSKNKESLVNMYNLFIAMDPALTTFAQSSPFYQGKRLGKDARVIMYRGGKELDSPHGLYANMPSFGSLQQYKTTGECN